MQRLLWMLLSCVLSAPVSAQDATSQMVAAASAGREGEVRDLLVQGVDANAKNGSGRPVLVVAGFNGNRRTALVLLAAGADVNATDEGGTSALMAASATAPAPTSPMAAPVSGGASPGSPIIEVMPE